MATLAERVEDLVVDEEKLVERVLVEADLLQHVEGRRRDLLQVAEADQPIQEWEAPVVEVVQTWPEQHAEQLDYRLCQVRRTLRDPHLQHFSSRACKPVIETMIKKVWPRLSDLRLQDDLAKMIIVAIRVNYLH